MAQDAPVANGNGADKKQSAKDKEKERKKRQKLNKQLRR